MTIQQPTTQQLATETIVYILETMIGTSDIFGTYIGNIIQALSSTTYDGEYVFRSYYEKSKFMVWYASVALSKDKYNNSVSAVDKARDYYNMIALETIDTEKHTPTLREKRELLALIEDVERDNETFNVDLQDIIQLVDDDTRDMLYVM